MTRVRITHWIVIPIPGYNLTWGHNSTWNQDPGSQFNVESWPGVTIQREILTRVTIQRGIMTRGHNSTLSYDRGSQYNVELWPRVKISRWIMTRIIVPHWIVIQIPGHNSTLNHDSGSQFNVEFGPGGHYSTWNKDPGSQFNRGGGQDFIRRRGRNTMTPCLGGRNSTWKIHLILTTARWIKTPRVEIQWDQNSILHRKQDKFGRDRSRHKNTCKSQSGTGPGVGRSKRPLLACRTHCKCSMETLHNSLKSQIR